MPPFGSLVPGSTFVREERLEPGFAAQPVTVADGVVPRYSPSGNVGGASALVAEVPVGYVIGIELLVLLRRWSRSWQPGANGRSGARVAFSRSSNRFSSSSGRPHAKHQRAAEIDQCVLVGSDDPASVAGMRARKLPLAGGEHRKRAGLPAANQQLGGGVDTGVEVVEEALAGVLENTGTDRWRNPVAGCLGPGEQDGLALGTVELRARATARGAPAARVSGSRSSRSSTCAGPGRSDAARPVAAHRADPGRPAR